MSIRDIVRQVKPVLEKNSIDYTYFIQDLLSEQAEFPSEVFDGFPFGELLAVRIPFVNGFRHIV